jgi:nucleotide-binding universal stress UspA family protein
MIVGEDGRVAGSINRVQVYELLVGTDDEELQAYYRGLLGESEEGAEYDNPSDEAEAEDKAAEAPASDEDLDALRAQLEELGVKVDGRWGEQRLRDEIAAAEAEG